MVDDWKALENLSIASSVYRELMLKERVQYLAPEVIKILGANGYMTASKDVDLPNCFNVRKVCKSWNKGVDNYFDERYNDPQMQFTSKFGKKNRFYSTISCNFTNRIDSLAFLGTFGSTHANADRNPFVGKVLAVALRDNTVNIVLDILRIYGNHVWSLKFDKFSTVLMQSLFACLSCTPNLRRLEISGDLDGFFVRHAAPPVLHKLVTFKSKLKLALDTGMLESNPSIKNLQFTLKYAQRSRSFDFPKVEQLKLVLNTTMPLFNFKTVAIKLLIIHWKNFGTLEPLGREGSYFFIRKFFNSIKENWGNAEYLKEVELELPGYTSLSEITSILNKPGILRLHLSRVEKLKLLMYNPYAIDFLLPLQETLKYLRVKMQYHLIKKKTRNSKFLKSLAGAKQSQFVQFLGYERRMLESNIWTIFPQLQDLVVEGHLGNETDASFPLTGEAYEKIHYTRSHWEKSNM